MIRVLHVYPKLSNAGTEMVIMNLYRNIDREKVQFDFLIQVEGELDSAFQSMGARFYKIEKTKNYSRDIELFFTKHPEYQIVHTHMHVEMGIVLKQASKCGVKVRIAHSHNSRKDLPRIVKLYKILTGWDVERYATHFIACSTEAAEWLFPRKNREAKIWNNAIQLERFLFKQDTRTIYREKLGIPANARVVCHVGRFAKQKNHERIIAILNKMTKQDEYVYGILVGVGPLLDEIKAKSESDRILFLGNRTDIPNILCASDVFLFPSLYEGLGIVAVEAQASGLMCIASENVPKEADIGTGMFKRIGLKEMDHVWENAIYESFNITERQSKSEASLKSNYNIYNVAAEAERFYLYVVETDDSDSNSRRG